MKKTLIATAAVGALAILAGAAVAQNAGQAASASHAMRGDADADGRISRTEFVDGRVARLTAVDANRDGSVSAEEIRSGVDTRRNQQASARFEAADTDGNGALSREEFVAVQGQRGDHAGRAGRGGRGHRMAGAGGGMDLNAGGHAARGPVAIADVQSRTTAAFARMDKDSDGYLTAEERQSARAEMRQGRQERRGDRMGGRMGARGNGSMSPSTPPSE